MEQWVETRKSGDFAGISEEFGIDPVIARIIRNRNIIDKDDIRSYLKGGWEDLHNPNLLKDAKKGAAILAGKIADNQKIRVIGDYDIDGVSAAYILVAGIRKCGAYVDAAIPNRMKDGYGMNESLIHAAAQDGVDTILTCDNGIAAMDAVAYAKELGMTVIITDHHDIPFQIEEDGTRKYLESSADAIINPKQADCAYPYKELCGAAVAWKFLQVLYEQMNVTQKEANEFIENVGFATVGDVMDLTGENRILVKLGLEALQHTKNPGMRALIVQSGLQEKRLSAYHIGFVLGPCLNASGRLDTAQRALSLLLETEPAQAAALAEDLTALNESRKEMTKQETEYARQMIEGSSVLHDKVMVVFLPDCHESIAGIIAGRIRELYHHPVFVLTRGEEGLKGSGRSIETYSMFEELSKVSDLLTKYGGHPMAAGFSMEEKDIETFRVRLNENAVLTDSDFEEVIRIDAAMPLSYLTLERIRQLAVLEPYGKGNTKPVFADRNIQLISYRIVGKKQNVLKLDLLSSDGVPVKGVYFGEPDKFLSYLEEKYGRKQVEAARSARANNIRFAAIYEPSIDTYGKVEQIQIILRNYR